MKKLVNIDKIKRGLYNNILKESHSESLNEFVGLISQDSVLQYQFYVSKNIKDALDEGVDNIKDVIKENLSFLDQYTEADYTNAQKKIHKFIIFEKGVYVDKLESSVYKLIESHIFNGFTPVTSRLINNVIKEHKELPKVEKVITEHIDIGVNTDVIIKVVLDKFNKKYGQDLNESQKVLLNAIFNDDYVKQEECFESIKNTVISSLEKDVDLDSELLKETVNKIKSMVYSKDSLINDVISLNNLI